MDQLRQSGKDNDKYFDLVIPKQSLDSFNVEKLKEMRSQLKKLQNEDLMQKLQRKSKLVVDQTQRRQEELRQKNFERVKKVVDQQNKNSELARNEEVQKFMA